MRRDTAREKPWWYREDDWFDVLKQALLVTLAMVAGLGLAAWDGHGISFADSWVTAFSLFLIFLAVGACISALAAAIAAFALYRQWRDKKLGRYTEFHE